MSETNQHSVAPAADVKHEVENINIKPLVMFLIYLSIVTAGTCGLMYGLFTYFESRAATLDRRNVSPLAAERELLPPQPRLQLAPNEAGQTAPNVLQDHPLVELRTLRAEENNKLIEPAWLNEKEGIVRLPIERAKALLLEKGLPTRAEPPPTNEAKATPLQPAPPATKSRAQAAGKQP